MASSTPPPPRRFLPVAGGHHGSRNAQTCLFRCGNACAHPVPNLSANESFGDIVTRAISRRSVLRGGAAAALVVGAGGLGACAPDTNPPPRDPVYKGLSFAAVAPNTLDAVTVPDGYRQAPVVRWGEPMLENGPAFDITAQTAEAQVAQFGYNNDFVGFLRLDDRRALLVVNHEYTNEVLMFPGWTPKTATDEQRRIALMAHGMSVVQIERAGRANKWVLSDDRGSYNRRITGATPFAFTGPARGSDLLKTSVDPAGTTPLGTLSNCSGSVTPWGTVLSGEENFDTYFSAAGGFPAPYAASYERYGFAADRSRRGWEDVDPRFDLTKEPTEGHRFGWIVEVDPTDPASTPRKHTALGRFKHEGATISIAKDGRAVAYMGDDTTNEYLYKFVSRKKYREGDGQSARAHNFTLLEDGDLYVARFTGQSPAAEIDGSGELPAQGVFDGTGQWLPLVIDGTSWVPGKSVEEVLVFTREAADNVEATKMDRPEDVRRNPVTGGVFVALTNNSERRAGGAAGPSNPAVDEANPVALTEDGEAVGNKYGHVIEMREDGNDAAATGFRWQIFMVCGDPEQPYTYFAGFDKTQVSPISCPDNLMFDRRGNLWIATDGAPDTIGTHDGFFATPVEGEGRGRLKAFLTVPVGAEATGPAMSEDDRSIFVAVQHPGEGGSYDEPTSTFPGGPGTKPRPSVVAVWREDGKRIGT